MKIVALVGLVVIMGLAVGSMMMGRSQPQVSAAPAAPLKHFHRKVVAPAVKTLATKNAAPAKTKAVAPAPAKPKAQPKLVSVPAVTNGMPTPLYELLHGHQVVVIALWDPEVPSDRYSFLEAQAGARAANAGFLGVSILDERIAGPLTAMVGNGTVLQSPGILIFKRPAMLMNKIDGFSDRDAIAEAIANAMIADAPMQGVAPLTAVAAPATSVPAVAAP
jgi:hypothetical protein